jgi:beta-glucosidase/6-phospho-beta-glucosidase/beta-galactosidase
LSWFRVDQGKGKYDFSRYEAILRIGQQSGMTQIWDLTHYSMPVRYEDPTYLIRHSDEFVERFADYAVAAARLLRRYNDGTMYLVPIGEISFWAYMAARREWAPFGISELDFKVILVRASIVAMDAIQVSDQDVRFIQADPIVWAKPMAPVTARRSQLAEEFAKYKFETWDMLSGRLYPELGGSRRHLEILGANYYPHNQMHVVGACEDLAAARFYPHNQKSFTFEVMPLDDPDRASVAVILEEAHRRYGCPILVTETGAWGDWRVRWWRTFLEEIGEARARVPVLGVCAYPFVDRRDFHLRHLTNSGLVDFVDGDLHRREPYQPVVDVIGRFLDALPATGGAMRPGGSDTGFVLDGQGVPPAEGTGAPTWRVRSGSVRKPMLPGRSRSSAA